MQLLYKFSLLGKKLPDGKPKYGKGKCTNLRSDALQSLYCRVLNSDKENSEAIAKGVMVTLYHYSSTKENPQHQYCPEGETSGCKFLVDKYNSEHTYRPV